jgi:hypothetical protein
VLTTEAEIESIAAVLRCPISWDEICPDLEFARQLYFMWLATMRRHEVDRESALLSYEDWQPDRSVIETMHDRDDVRSRLINAKIWRPRAETEYVDTFRRFSELRVATVNDYDKHYIAWSASDAEVRDASVTRNAGILYPRCNTSWQRSLAFAALGREWADTGAWWDFEDSDDPTLRAAAFNAVFAGNGSSVLIELGYDIGCSAGCPTRFALLRYDFSAPYLVHVYPCRQEDYARAHTPRYIPYELLDAPTVKDS